MGNPLITNNIDIDVNIAKLLSYNSDYLNG